MAITIHRSNTCFKTTIIESNKLENRIWRHIIEKRKILKAKFYNYRRTGEKCVSQNDLSGRSRLDCSAKFIRNMRLLVLSKIQKVRLYIHLGKVEMDAIGFNESNLCDYSALIYFFSCWKRKRYGWHVRRLVTYTMLLQFIGVVNDDRKNICWNAFHAHCAFDL